MNKKTDLFNSLRELFELAKSESARQERRVRGGMVDKIVKLLFFTAMALAMIAIIMLLLYFVNLAYEKLLKEKFAQATCPHCNTTVIKEYSLIKPWTGACQYCGTKIKYKKS